MRVLHISSGNLYGGVETLLVTLARCRHLCPEMEPHFALSFEGQVSQELRSTGAQVHHLGEVRASRPWTIRAARKRLRSLLQAGNFHSVICHMPWPLAVFGPAVGNSAKLVFWLHNPVSGTHWIERWARRSEPDLAICNSQFTASSLPNLFPGIRNITAYCPVELDKRHATSETRSSLRKKLETPDDGVAILQVSRMEDWKGHRLHLQALSMLKDLPNWTAWFVGGVQRQSEEEYLNQLRKSAHDLGIVDRIRFLGQRSDIAEIMGASDIFCQPNQEPEPFGIVFVEALLAGIPVVSTCMGGVLEIVDQSCGKLVPPAREALALALRELISSADLRTHLGRNGRAHAQDLCDPKTQLNKLRHALKHAA